MVYMKHSVALTLIMGTLVLSACGKKKEPLAQNTPAPAATQSMTPTPAAEPSQDDAERAKKQELLDYATMEDQYINDPHAQWASSATASSTFGDDNGAKPAEVNAASNAVGPVDDKSWTNNRQDVGFDWLELGFAKPVRATEVRVVFAQAGAGVEAVSKVEVEDAQGHWTTVWSGLSDVKADSRGARTWFVRKFDKTPTPTKGVKITIANNVQRGYKVVDAVQLVGE
jgi:cell division septation protein DedD